MEQLLNIGLYDIPEDCRAKIIEGGRKIEIAKRKDIRLSPDEKRCGHCKHYVSGHAVLNLWTTTVCNAKPKKLSEALEKRKAAHKVYKNYTLYYGAQRNGKICEMFEEK